MQDDYKGLEVPPSTDFDAWWEDRLIEDEEADLILEDDYSEEDFE